MIGRKSFYDGFLLLANSYYPGFIESGLKSSKKSERWKQTHKRNLDACWKICCVFTATLTTLRVLKINVQYKTKSLWWYIVGSNKYNYTVMVFDFTKV